MSQWYEERKSELEALIKAEEKSKDRSQLYIDDLKLSISQLPTDYEPKDYQMVD